MAMFIAFWHIGPLRYLALMFLVVLAMTAPWSGTADAYEYDHYALTYYLALQAGFTKRQAFQIASATYALDFDPNLSPMQATVGDALLGANHAFLGLFGNKKPELAAIWSNYHAFADEEITKLCSGPEAWVMQVVNPDNQCLDTIMIPRPHGQSCPPAVFTNVETSRRKRKQALAALAVSEGNPGVLLHYVQDYYAHFAFDNFSGHAIAAHIPDFLSYDSPKAECAARDTIGALEEFRNTVTSFDGTHEPLLPQKPLTRDDARIAQVVAQLIEINPMVGSYLPWESPTHLSVEGPDRAAPLPGRSIAVIDNAILKDEKDGRLPKWPGKIDAYEALMPPKWFKYTYAPNGSIAEPKDVLMLRTPGPVEQVAFKFGTYKIDTNPSAEHPGMLKVHLRLPYTISGLAAMFDGEQNNYLTPLPVIEKERLSDESDFASHEQKRMNGDFAIEREVERSEKDLDQASWTVAVQLYGYEPVEKTISLAPKTALPDCWQQMVQREKKDFPEEDKIHQDQQIMDPNTAKEILMDDDELAGLCSGGAVFTPMQQNTCNRNLRYHSVVQSTLTTSAQQCQDLCAGTPLCGAFQLAPGPSYVKGSFSCNLLACPGKFSSTYSVNQYDQHVDDPGPQPPAATRPCDGIVTANKCHAAAASPKPDAGNAVEQDVGGHPR